MSLNNILNTKCEWLSGDGPDCDIVLSSRIRLARNLKGIPFPNAGDYRSNNEVLEKIFRVLRKTSFFKKGLVAKLSEMSDLEKQILLERHLISKEHLINRIESGVAISEKQDLSIMVNEEDHMRIQVLKSGFRLDDCWELIDNVDSELEQHLDFAYSPAVGYLTACPTNVGTGMRASIMLHLPGLVLMELINKVMQAVIKLGMTVRGFYGEGSEVLGNLFQISNQVTLGKSEKEIISNLNRVLNLVVEHERNSRQLMRQKNEARLQDRIGRAYGILANAHIISSKETISLISALRMGMDMGYINGIGGGSINELFIVTQPAHLQQSAGELLDAETRDILRAKLIRERLKQK
ncbi:MAG: protein arginine kinase [Candidatus Auribacterota bacterium]|jgi:protein arginine kinase|nr:protein arginine kinase [Candidatus Auribacterota bacterium]